MTNDIPLVSLSNGAKIPALMLGSFQVKSLGVMQQIVQQSIALGGYGFDTSPSYKTEPLLGKSLDRCFNTFHDLNREQLFIQTKIDAPQMIDSKGDVRKYVESALSKLKLDYLDAILIHWPFPDYLIETWKSFEALYEEGYARAIGICNVKPRHIDLLEATCSIQPHIVQNEINPLNTDDETTKYAKNRGILVQSYSPLARMLPDVTDSKKLQSIAKKHDKSIAQVILRWQIERGCLPIVKTDKPYRIAENFDVFSFSLTEGEVKAISKLNRDLKVFLESRCCPGL